MDLSIDERRVRMSERVERLSAVGKGVDFTPFYIEQIVAHMFADDPEGFDHFQEEWLDTCETLLTEEKVQEAEKEAARAALKLPQQLKGQLSLVDG